jgi:hypothetical protein
MEFGAVNVLGPGNNGPTEESEGHSWQPTPNIDERIYSLLLI